MGSVLAADKCKKYEIQEINTDTRATRLGDRIITICRDISSGGFVCNTLIFDQVRSVYQNFFCFHDHDPHRIICWFQLDSFCVTIHQKYYIVSPRGILTWTLDTLITILKLNLSSSLQIIFGGDTCYRIWNFICTSNGKYAYATFGFIINDLKILVRIDLQTGDTIQMVNNTNNVKSVPINIYSIAWDPTAVIPESVIWIFDEIRQIERMLLPLTTDQIWKYILAPNNIVSINLIHDIWSIVSEYLTLYYFKHGDNNSIFLSHSIVDCLNSLTQRQESRITALVTIPNGKLLFGTSSSSLLFGTSSSSISKPPYFRLFVFNPIDSECKEIMLHSNGTSQHYLSNFIWDQENNTLLFSNAFGLFQIKIPNIT